ncbi:Fructose-1,6-bisphosphatase, type I [hydrothermal vent metagenome]|uniref:fructose-bisphosphatase n=1 Tax=hydrothermal vent metagenome TaxID=652676 RepID=A0A3B1BXJ6_9ZZZZ
MPDRLGTTISKHIFEHQKTIPSATGDFTGLLSELVVATKVIAREVNKAGLVDVLGKTGDRNVQGEEVQKLDDYANTIIVQKMDHTGYLCAMASEEVEEIIEIADKHPQGGRYTLAFDPLDGSSNIDANVSIGTIFSIHKKISDAPKGVEKDFLQPGKKQIGAGYVIYGSSTMLVYSAGQGVHGFTLDPSIGEFILSHPNIAIPKRGKIYSVNEGNYYKWDDKVKKAINYFKAADESSGRPYSTRYIGSLVSDFHRNLLYGGIFMYPADTTNPKGKLRLLYEAAPLAFICAQAGGGAIAGADDILDIEPTQLHQRIPLYIGSKDDVEVCRKLLR